MRSNKPIMSFDELLEKNPIPASILDQIDEMHDFLHAHSVETGVMQMVGPEKYNLRKWNTIKDKKAFIVLFENLIANLLNTTPEIALGAMRIAFSAKYNNALHMAINVCDDLKNWPSLAAFCKPVTNC